MTSILEDVNNDTVLKAHLDRVRIFRQERVTVESFTNQYLAAHKGLDALSLSLGLAEALVQYFGGDKEFTLPPQPNETSYLVQRF